MSEFDSLQSFVFHLLSVAAAFAKYHPHYRKTRRILPAFAPKGVSWKLAFSQD